MKRILISHFTYLLFIYIIGIIFFQLLRLPLILSNISYLKDIDKEILRYAIFNTGLKFDSVYNSLLLLVPFIILSIDYFIKSNTILKAVTYYYILFAFSISFIIAASDFAYFNYYNSRINISILSWTDDIPTMLEAMVSTKDYFIAFIISLFSIVLFYLIIRKYFKYFNVNYKQDYKTPIKILFTVLTLAILFLGVRGNLKFNKHPLVPSDAFRTPFNMANQISLNGPHHFFFSIGGEAEQLMNDEEAIANVIEYLNIDSIYKKPIKRKVEFNDSTTKPNIILILMESMSYSKVGLYTNNGLTPNIDSLIEKSLFFPNTYSSGIHTYNGIFASVYGLPSVKRVKQTSSSAYVGASFSGFPNILKELNYNSSFFCTGNLNFDNLHSFLPSKGFDLLFGEDDYDKKHKRSVWGVGDHVMFDKALSVYDTLSQRSPFFSVLLTVSTHPPYEYPTNTEFQPSSSNKVDMSYEYMDWAIGKFIKDASNKPWFNNSIFIFVGDHGQLFDTKYEIPLSYVHVPMFIYTSDLKAPKIYETMSMQIDILPTVLSLAKLPYINNTLGIDLTNESREYAYFCADAKIGCIDNEYLFILRENNESLLFNYKNNESKNYADSLSEKAQSMKNYAVSMLQTTNHLVNHKLAGIDN